MKNSSLFIGLGIGLLAGAAIGAYLASSDDDKAKLKDGINSTVEKAKKTIGKIVDEGLEKLDKVVQQDT
jgi:hypothetical protein